MKYVFEPCHKNDDKVTKVSIKKLTTKIVNVFYIKSNEKTSHK